MDVPLDLIQSPSLISITVTICVAGTVLLAILRLTRRDVGDIRDIPGPVDNVSWLYGNLPQLLLSCPYGKFQFEWQKQYGSTYRLKGCFSKDVLLTSDPVALRFIVNSPKIFDLSPNRSFVLRMLLGEESLLALRNGGPIHRRIKNALSPAFTLSRLQQYIPVMRDIARKATNKTMELCMDSQSKGEQNTTINIYRLLQLVTSDTIGEVGFGHNFNAVETNGGDRVVQSHQNILVLGSRRTKKAILRDGVFACLPRTLLNVMRYLPTQTSKTFESFLELTVGWAADCLAQNAHLSDSNGTGQGLLGSVAAASRSQKREPLSHESICRQVPTLLVGGQDTTANALSWAIYELAKRPTWQDQIRKEISKAQDADLNFDKLEYLNAHIKESLRLHPSGPLTHRMAFEDTTLPLSQPLTTTSGRVITELPIRKGQTIELGVAACNRDPHIWGLDASLFDPLRWLDGRYDSANLPGIGPYSNLATFLGGSRVCVGWRLAVLEMQVVIFELLSKFQFSITPEQDQNVTESLAMTVLPLDVSTGKPGLSILVRPTEAHES